MLQIYKKFALFPNKKQKKTSKSDRCIMIRIFERSIRINFPVFLFMRYLTQCFLSQKPLATFIEDFFNKKLAFLKKSSYLCTGYMISVVKIAAYICQRYQQEFGEQIDEMKLHKLLYFVQRECLVQKEEPLFPEQLHAWKYGPVMPQIRQLYKEGLLTELPSQDEIAIYQPVFDEVFREYAHSHPLTLVSISHSELSWKRAREGYGKYESSDVPMKLGDIREDAERYKERLAMLKIQSDFLNSKGITNHEQFLRDLARHRVPVV